MRIKHFIAFVFFFSAFFVFSSGYKEICPYCFGSGKCSTCGGDGISGQTNCHGQVKYLGCTACGGQAGGVCEGGYAGSGICRYCKGSGVINGTKVVYETDEARDKKIKDSIAKVKAIEELKAEQKRLELEAEKRDAEKRLGTDAEKIGIQKTEINKKSDSNIFGLNKESGNVVLYKTEASNRTNINTPVQQLYCAFDLMNYISNYTAKIKQSVLTEADINEMKFLAEEVNNALNGVKRGLECDLSQMPQTSAGQLNVEKRQKLLKQLANSSVIESQIYFDLNKKLNETENNNVIRKSRIEQLNTEIKKIQTDLKTNSSPSKDVKMNDEKAAVSDEIKLKELKEKQSALELVKKALEMNLNEAEKLKKELSDSANSLEKINKLNEKLKDPAMNVDELEKQF